MKAEATIRTVGLSTGYRDKHGDSVISNSLDERLYPGELTCLLGPNGAGKSTLLRTLAGFQKPLKGTVEIMGKDITRYSDRNLARTVSVVLTEKPMLENMDVETLVSMGRAPYTGFWGRLNEMDYKAVESAISLTGIDALRHRMVHTLSDGERQKVMIAKAFAQETPVIFLDEPTAFLDFPSKVDIMQLLFSLSRKLDKTIFLSTHDLDLALQLADKVWLIDKKIGISAGVPEDLSLSGKLSEYFVRPGVYFDSFDGLFKIDVKMKSEVSLRGEGEVANMARKALYRNGIFTTSEKMGIDIAVCSGRIHVNGRECHSIAAMLDAVEELQNKDNHGFSEI